MFKTILTITLFVFLPLAQGKTILVFGDSLSSAYKLNPDDGWVMLIDKKLQQLDFKQRMVNASIPGETTRGGLARLQSALQHHDPVIVILELGGNDGLRGFHPNTSKLNLEKMIKLTEKHGAKTLLIGIQLPPNYGKRYTDLFREIYPQLAAEFKLSFMPFLLEGVGTNKALIQEDGIHPSLEAQPLIADQVWLTLARMLAETP